MLQKGELNMANYVAINLRKEYTDAIDEAIENDPFISSRAEFIRRAIEKFIKEINLE